MRWSDGFLFFLCTRFSVCNLQQVKSSRTDFQEALTLNNENILMNLCVIENLGYHLLETSFDNADNCWCCRGTCCGWPELTPRHVEIKNNPMILAPNSKKVYMFLYKRQIYLLENRI